MLEWKERTSYTFLQRPKVAAAGEYSHVNFDGAIIVQKQNL